MQIIENNYIPEVPPAKEEYEYPLIVICDKCESRFMVNEEDVYIKDAWYPYNNHLVDCPCCGKKEIWLKKRGFRVEELERIDRQDKGVGIAAIIFGFLLLGFFIMITLGFSKFTGIVEILICILGFVIIYWFASIE